ncbi:malonyl-ACP O-methyltransferase BioC [Zooshikella ganghwensis]|uniref:Malonyl-[acyl-carrier protein] O-methyltransferase n=1 Tax=Zooshikella ganghwensis TaxID=202772 RepID=A0A4P9VJ88_9GAMM|nr:malonyl-ACP O-methyltransferase BioC [Zooshikella ganghwensis]RDH42240.1 malonyl-[acyl-carrier protein] O-methyltransferase BioC [Zooshikella ganghwensis]
MILVDKEKVARSFSRAAQQYDSVAKLQRLVGNRLMSFLPSHVEPRVILDLGCGTGYFTTKLARVYETSQLLACDIAMGMLQFARQRYQKLGATWLSGDAEQLPIRSQSVDLVFSSLAIQWCSSPAAVFSEISRVLRPGGYFVFTTLGAGTLNELRDAWSQVDSYNHVNHYPGMLAHEKAIQQSGLEQLMLERQPCTMHYQELSQLTRELKSLGANTVLEAPSSGLTTFRRLRHLRQAYERYRNDDGNLPATYQVIYGVLKKK